ncbi:ABC transporter ATP-binding protein [Mycoplasma iguanae]|uniref:ABC transporter ATP-binding protein n=1 Tax=Mycoplasma iguanae TaxID=292461 RepID=A0ABY5R8T2_9MOLU|nr:ABC transporter ATP-binding protein [Mycoplasma iguanae]UVD81903.1 ABC transporter ATP-binding protein [Mycoplasma iguanae]
MKISNKNKILPSFLEKNYQKLLAESKDQTEDNNVLELRNIDKVYDNGFQAIFGTNIKIKKGEFLALLGPSGCGKSTTLRMIAGLEDVTSGEVILNNVNVTNLEPASRNLTMVFQNYALFPHLTVKQNISFGLKSNKKKLGQGGKIFKQILFLKNNLKANLNLLNSIKNLEKSKTKIIAFEKHLTKLEQQLEQLLKTQTNTSTWKRKFKKLKIQKNMLENIIEISKNKVQYYEAKKDLQKPIILENEKIKQEIEVLEKQRIQLAKNDNYKQIIDQKVELVSKVLGLEYYLNQKPGALSGGQRQRVALGRSIVGNPTLFLMDEPLSNLDAKLRATMRTEIRSLHEKINAGTVYVTHDQIEAMTMADKIVVMADGFVLQTGTPSDVYKNPSCIFVAGFVGTPSMNFISGQVKNKTFVSDKGLVIHLDYPDKIQNTYDGQKVILGIRPTDFAVDENFKEVYKAIKVKITHKELLGNEIQYKALIKVKEEFLEEIIFITNSYENYEVGSIQEISPIHSRVHLFDQETSIALTSKFNLETISALKNWIISEEKIQIRREILEKSKNKKKYSLIKKLKNQIFKKEDKNEK